MRHVGRISSSPHERGTAPIRRASLSLAGAVLLSLLLAGQSMAATWAPPVRLTAASHDTEAIGLVTLNASTVVAVYATIGDEWQLFIKRSTDSGATWSSRTRLAADYWSNPAFAGRGSNVDVVWLKYADVSQVVRYARSTNGGASFGASVRLSPTSGQAFYPSVAHGPNGRVAVAWADFAQISPGDEAGFRRIVVRVSTDGGASFARAKTLVSGYSESVHTGPVVAIGNGVIYVAYYDSTGLVVRRSTDSGSTWGKARLIATGYEGDDAPLFHLTANGSEAYLSYVKFIDSAPWFATRVRRTTDKGVTWARVNVPGLRGYNLPFISLKGGIARAVFTKRLDSDTGAVFYTQSADGTSWTTPKRISVPADTPSVGAAGVGFAGNIIVLYTGSRRDYTDSGVYVRVGTP